MRNGTVGDPGVHVIEQILRLETQLQAARFTPQPEIFQKREIPLAEARAAHVWYRAAHVADLEALHQAERRGIEIGPEICRALESAVTAHVVVIGNARSHKPGPARSSPSAV